MVALKTYTVKKGDTLSKIAKLHNTTVKKLQESNPSLISDVNKISVGWVLNIPLVVTPNRCSLCEAYHKALLDIKNLKSVKELEKIMGE